MKDKSNTIDIYESLVALLACDENRRLEAKNNLARYLEQHALALNNADTEFNRVLATDVPIFITAFLIEVLKQETLAEPQHIVELLEAVSGYFREKQLGAYQRVRAQRIHELLLKEYDLFVEMLRGSNTGLRIYVMGLLRNIPEKSTETANILLQHIEKPQILDELDCLTAISNIFEFVETEISEHNTLIFRFIHILNQWCERSTTSEPVKARAACYLILLQEGQVPQSIVDVLIEILQNANLTDPGEDFDLTDLWKDALLLLGIERATDIFLRIFDYQQDGCAIIEVAAILLVLHFGSGDIHSLYFLVYQDGEELHAIASLEDDSCLTPEPAQNYTRLQKEILEHFVRKEQFWGITTNLLGLFALPNDQELLRSIL